MSCCLDKSRIIEQMQSLTPPGGPCPADPDLLRQLQALTAQLINAYQQEGRLSADPFAAIPRRTLSIHAEQARSILAGQTVLVTGGEGFVGQRLIETLLELGAGRILSVDIARPKPLDDAREHRVVRCTTDVRNAATLAGIFKKHRPSCVFHLAAERLPWKAEQDVGFAVSTNVLGTCNLIDACERHGVSRCVFSSTGKASRYFTTEVYAATKKLAEWMFYNAALGGTCTYGMVRFTHMLENSSVCEQLDLKVAARQPIPVHAPNRFVVAQNVQEAVHLLINALVLAKPPPLKCLVVRDLGWPVETLELALWKIVASGQKLPIYFQGIPVGYEETFFRGQVDWDYRTELNTLVNAHESRQPDESGDMLIIRPTTVAPALLRQCLAELAQVIQTSPTENSRIKSALVRCMSHLAADAFAGQPAEILLKTLCWGCDSRFLQADGLTVERFAPLVALLVRSLHGRLNPAVLRRAGISEQAFDHLLETLSPLKELANEVTSLRFAAHSSRDPTPPQLIKVA